MTLARITTPKNALIISAAASASLLAGAHLFERVGGLAPCLLCLDQREVHWAALAVALVGLVLTHFIKDFRLLMTGIILLGLVYLYSFYMGSFHAGVEWGFWPGPAACAAGGHSLDTGVSGDDLLASLNTAGPSGPSCSEAAWRMLGISMAGYNALMSLGLAGIAGVAAFTARTNTNTV